MVDGAELQVAKDGSRARLLVMAAVTILSDAGARFAATVAAIVRSAGERVAAAVRSIRLPVRYGTHARTVGQVQCFVEQSLTAVGLVECRERRAKAFLALATAADEVGRDTAPFLTAAMRELEVRQYWERKQSRIVAAARHACAAAELAARTGHPGLARDAYLCGQVYYGKVEDTDRRIALAAAFADVAHLLSAAFDQASWLSTAMELAVGIDEPGSRIVAVNFVARKMVRDSVPPCEDRREAGRFGTDALTGQEMRVGNGIALLDR